MIVRKSHSLGTLGALACAALAFAMMPVAQAQAEEVVHTYEGSFQVSGNPQGIATDSSGNVYVYDPTAGTISKYSATGAELEFKAGEKTISLPGAGSGENEIAVDDSKGNDAGDIYVANGSLHEYTPEGELVTVNGEEAINYHVIEEIPGTNWGLPCGVAVSASGDVYAGLWPERVDEFKYAGGPVVNSDYESSLAFAPSLEVCNVAVGTNGEIYGATYTGSAISRFQPSAFNRLGTGQAAGEEFPGGATLAVDTATNDLYIDQGKDILQYNQSGEAISTITGGSEPLEESYGVAIGPTGRVYIADNAHSRIDIYSPGIRLPEPIAEHAANVTATTATLTGTVNPEGRQTTYQVEYGAGSQYETYEATSPATPLDAGSGASALPVSVPLADLAPNTLYHYRFVATSDAGTKHGPEQLFKTAGLTAAIDDVTQITSSGATINGTIDTQDIPGATYRLAVTSTSSAYAMITPPVALATTSESQTVSSSFTGLPAAGTYDVTLLVAAGQQEASSIPTTFQTTEAPPTIIPPGPPVYATPYAGAIINQGVPTPTTSLTTIATKAKAKIQTNAKKLTAALKACQKKPRNKRIACQKAARKRYKAARARR